MSPEDIKAVKWWQGLGSAAREAFLGDGRSQRHSENAPENFHLVWVELGVRGVWVGHREFLKRYLSPEPISLVSLFSANRWGLRSSASCAGGPDGWDPTFRIPTEEVPSVGLESQRPAENKDGPQTATLGLPAPTGPCEVTWAARPVAGPLGPCLLVQLLGLGKK